MAKGIFAHRPDSIYDDLPETQYQFPKVYKSRVDKLVGDWIIYYEPRGGCGRLGYNAVAKVQQVIPDPSIPDMFIAIIEPGSFLPFERFVPYNSETGFLESGLDTGSNKPSGLIRNAVREIPENDFYRILSRAFEADDYTLPRIGEGSRESQYIGVQEPVADFDFEVQRPRVEQKLNRAVRDRIFRKTVIDAYDRKCAVTGLQLINGGGRAEVEAAHIKPVAHGGPDSIRNGIALSGTVHWMFDRGLISLSDDLHLLVSRQVNNPDQIWALANKDRKAQRPLDEQMRPHPSFLGWHRENCFKH